MVQLAIWRLLACGLVLWPGRAPFFVLEASVCPGDCSQGDWLETTIIKDVGTVREMS